MTSPATQLWLPPSARTQEFKKAPPPKMGPAYGTWSGEMDMTYMSLPGGAMLQFDLSRLTLADFRTMRWHYQINISLAILAFTLHQLDWRIECDDNKIREEIEQQWAETWTRFIGAISQAFWAGYSPIALEFENDSISGKIKVNKYKDLIPEKCKVNWKTVDGYAPPGQVKPKRYLFDGIKQEGNVTPIPPENSLWYPVLMENGDYYGRKLLKAAFPAWFFSQIIHLFANRYFERFGEPLPIGRAPYDDDVQVGSDEFITGREVMERIIGQIRSRAAVVLPASRTKGGAGDKDDWEYSIDYLESQMRGADFERYLKRLDEEMSLAMFMPVLLFRTADIGSYNLGQAHERMFMWHMNALAGDIKQYIDKYVLSRLVDFNFSPKAPRATFHFRRLGKDRDETIRAMVQGAIQQELIRPDIDELGQALGMKLHEIRQVASETGEIDAALEPTAEGLDDPAEAGQTVSESTLQRAKGQIAKAWSKGQAPRISLGYQRQFTDALLAAGIPEPRARQVTTQVYGRTEYWLNDALSLGADAYSSPDEVIDMARRVMSGELEDALAAI